MLFQFSNKSSSTTYALVHRPQNDPVLQDDSSSSMVFQELAPTQARKIKNRGDLESELFGGSEYGGDHSSLRDNEGEAAEYGIYYDDTKYDYMQHMRDLNGGDDTGESYFLEAPSKGKSGKGKEKMSLEDALRESTLEDGQNGGGSTKFEAAGKPKLGDDVLPSKNLRQTNYEDQQDVPDVLSGFQPGMDPRLREVLEALDDEAYVDDEEDLFGELAKDRKELSLREFEELDLIDDEDDQMEDEGWESDDTAKPSKKYKSLNISCIPPTPCSVDVSMDDLPDHGDGDWMAEFSKFKKADTSKKAKAATPAVKANADLQSSTFSTPSSTLTSRHKKRKGAMTSTSNFSMTSSSLVRTEGLTLLDARFDKIEEEYAEDNGYDGLDDDEDGGASVMTGKSGMSSMSRMSKTSTTSSQVPSLTTRKDFDGIMDEFLGGYSMSGKKRVKKGKYQSGMEQLDEIRKELGRPKISV